MAERPWYAPKLVKRLRGDETLARQHLKRARAYVGYLFDQLRPGQTFRTQNFRLQDGTRIQAFVWRDVLGERATVRIYSPEVEVPVEVSICLLDHGYLVSETTSPDFPLTVYPTDALKPYFPSSYSSEVWVGPDDPTSLFSDGFTGLAKLFIQSKHGSSVDTDYGGVPSSWISSGFGVLRSPLSDETPRWWAVFASKTTGVDVIELLPDEAATKYISVLQNGALSSAERSIAEGCILASAVVEKDELGNPVTTEIMSVAEIADAYLTGRHLAWGWYFASQVPGSAQENTAKAVSAIYRYTFPTFTSINRWTHRAKLEFSFSGGVPSVSVNVDLEENFRLWEANTAIPGGPKIIGSTLHTGYTEVGTTTDQVVIACWFDDEGSDKWISIGPYSATGSFGSSCSWATNLTFGNLDIACSQAYAWTINISGEDYERESTQESEWTRRITATTVVDIGECPYYYYTRRDVGWAENTVDNDWIYLKAIGRFHYLKIDQTYHVEIDELKEIYEIISIPLYPTCDPGWIDVTGGTSYTNVLTGSAEGFWPDGSVEDTDSSHWIDSQPAVAGVITNLDPYTTYTKAGFSGVLKGSFSYGGEAVITDYPGHLHASFPVSATVLEDIAAGDSMGVWVGAA